MQQKQIHQNWQREYRKNYKKRQNEVCFQIVLDESDIQIVANKDLSSKMMETLRCLRSDIKTWASLYPDFKHSLSPLPVPCNAPEIVRRMYEGSAKAGVGPFAAVAGSIAQMLAENYAEKSPNLIVENGGDIYIYSECERVVALLASPNDGASLGLLLKPDDFPLALCASCCCTFKKRCRCRLCGNSSRQSPKRYKLHRNCHGFCEKYCRYRRHIRTMRRIHWSLGQYGTNSSIKG